MKKTLLLMLFALTATFAYSQIDIDEEEGGSYKQTGGSNSLELQLDPAAIFNASNTNPVLSNQIGIRYRMFSTSTMALRINCNISYANTNTVTQEEDTNTGNLELRTKTSALGVDLRPGLESHFNGTKRLSPYAGGELIIGYHGNTSKVERQAGTQIETQTTKNGDPLSGLTIGAAAVAGMDFYIAKKFFIGMELNYTFAYFMPSKTKISDTAPGSLDTESKLNKTNSFTLAPGALGVFRIGFIF